MLLDRCCTHFHRNASLQRWLAGKSRQHQRPTALARCEKPLATPPALLRGAVCHAGTASKPSVAIADPSIVAFTKKTVTHAAELENNSGTPRRACLGRRLNTQRILARRNGWNAPFIFGGCSAHWPYINRLSTLSGINPGAKECFNSRGTIVIAEAVQQARPVVSMHRPVWDDGSV